eukprot:12529838-Alexandrium_andersonii.AAC.1
MPFPFGAKWIFKAPAEQPPSAVGDQPGAEVWCPARCKGRSMLTARPTGPARLWPQIWCINCR